MEKYSKAFRSYIGTALWSSTNGEENMDSEYDIENFDKDTLSSLNREFSAFVLVNKNLLTEKEKQMDPDLTQFAHDFWLTRNGHGAGFWDGDYKEGEALTSASEKFGPKTLVVGDDGKIYAV